MKKALSLCLCLILTAAAYSQNENDPKKFHLGLITSGGIGWLTPETKNLEGGGAKAGIAFGIFGDFYFAKNYALSVELNHSTQGFKVTADSISRQSVRHSNVTIDYRIRSFQVPITLKLRTNEIGYMHYFGQIGVAPAFAYKTILADFSPGVYTPADENEDHDVNESENDFDYGDADIVAPEHKKTFLEEDNVRGFRMPLLIGAGAEWTISGNTAILFGVRYEYGLINMMKAEDAVARRNTFNLQVGVRF